MFKIGHLTRIASQPAAAAKAGRLKALLFVAATPIFVFLLARNVVWSDIWSSSRELGKRPELLTLFVLGFGAAFALRSLAWGALLSKPASSIALFRILHAVLLANHILPISAGDLLRPPMAARHDVPLAEGAATTLVARLLDFAALLALSMVLLPLVAFDSSSILYVLIIPASFLVMSAGFLIWFHVQDELHLPPLIYGKVFSVKVALQTISPKRIFKAFLLTLPAWILEGTVLFVASKAMGIELSLAGAIGVTAFTILFQAFRVTPGGIGVYEASMATALTFYGVPIQDGLTLALLTHGLKYAYSLSVGGLLTIMEVGKVSLDPLKKIRGSRTDVKKASTLEVAAARCWNVLNEGKPFTVVFVTGVILVTSLLHIGGSGYWLRAGAAIVALLPLFVLFFRYDYPLKLRWVLWGALAATIAFTRTIDPLSIALVLSLYLFFTVFLWGSVYYHLRIGAKWSNFTRFWRLVIENPDPTSGNFLEQAPKSLTLVLLFSYLSTDITIARLGTVEVFVAALAIFTVVAHQWLFTWVPPVSVTPTRLINRDRNRISKKVIAIVIDGCRADRLREANTPFIDRLRREGTDFVDVRTVYPARTVTCFSSMFTGASPKVHGMGSNFVASLGVKCESIFESLKKQGLKGKMVGIAHLIDAFGHDDVQSVTAVMDNDEVDHALVARAKALMQSENPDLMILQLISVDQTGHARGSYNREYLEKIEVSDKIIEEFLGWCDTNGYLKDATVLITADHGQGIGIGGHGHMTPSEIYVPCIMWGAGIEHGAVRTDTHSVMDIAPTISYLLGTMPPEKSTGQVMIGYGQPSNVTAIIIPARNEALNLPGVLAGIPCEAIPNVKVIVIDDGSTDDTSEVARRAGADVVVRHEQNRGLGAALRTGFVTALAYEATSAVYIDADGEYDSREIPLVLAPVLSGQADYVLGSRYRGKLTGQHPIKYIGNKILNAIVSMLSGHLISDGQTGMRAFSRKALQSAEIIHDYNYAQVLTLDLLKKGMKLAQVPITYQTRKSGRSFITFRYLWRVPLGIAREVLTS